MPLLHAAATCLSLLLFKASFAEDIPCGTVAFGKRTYNGYNRMVGANVADPHAYPWHAFIQTPKGTFSGSAVRFGSGNITDAVLTSAQAATLDGKLMSPDDVTVYFGVHDRAKKAKARAQVHSIKRFSLSNATTGQSAANDVAVFYLSKPVPLSEHVRPVCLPDAEDIEPQDTCIITGLNHMFIQRPTSNLLHVMQLRILPARECLKHYAFYNDKEHYCVGSSSANICPGDVGSPVVCQKNGRWVQMAFAMNGADCDRQEHVPSLLSRATRQHVFKSRPREVRIAGQPATQENVERKAGEGARGTSDAADTSALTKNKHSLQENGLDELENGASPKNTVKVNNNWTKNTQRGMQKRSTADDAQDAPAAKVKDEQGAASLKETNETANTESVKEIEDRLNESVGSEALNGVVEPIQHMDMGNATKEASSNATAEGCKCIPYPFNGSINEPSGTVDKEVPTGEVGNENLEPLPTPVAKQNIHPEGDNDSKAYDENLSANRTGQKTAQEQREDGKEYVPTKMSEVEVVQSSVFEGKPDILDSSDAVHKNDTDDNGKIDTVAPVAKEQHAAGSGESKASLKGETSIERKQDNSSNEAQKSPDLRKTFPHIVDVGQRSSTPSNPPEATGTESGKAEVPNGGDAHPQHGKKASEIEVGHLENQNATASSNEEEATKGHSITEPNEEHSNTPTFQKEDHLGNEGDSSLKGKVKRAAHEEEDILTTGKAKLGDFSENATELGSKGLSALEEGSIQQKEKMGSNLSQGLETTQSTPSSLLSTAKEKLADEKEEVAQHGSEGLEALQEGAVQQKEKIGSNLTEGLEAMQSTPSSLLSTVKGKLADAKEKTSELGSKGLSAIQEAIGQGKENVESIYTQRPEGDQTVTSSPLPNAKESLEDAKGKVAENGSKGLSAIQEATAGEKEKVESNYTQGLEPSPDAPSIPFSMVRGKRIDNREKMSQQGSKEPSALDEGTAYQKEKIGSNLTHGLEAMQSTPSSLLSTVKEKLGDEKEEVAQHGSEGLEALQEGAVQQKEKIGSNVSEGLEAVQSTPSSLLSTAKEKLADEKEEVAQHGSEGIEALQEGAVEQKEKIGSSLSEGLEAMQSTSSSLLSTVKGKLADVKDKVTELGSKGLSAIQEAIGQGKENVESIYTQSPEGDQTPTSSPLPSAKESLKNAKRKVAENGSKGLSAIQEAAAGEKEKVGSSYTQGLEPSPAAPSIPLSMVRGKRIDNREKMSQQGSKEPSALEEGATHQEENIGSNLTDGLEAMQSTSSSLMTTVKEKLGDTKEKVAENGSEGLEATQSTPSSLLSTVKGKLADAKDKVTELGSKGLSAIQGAIGQGKENVESIYTQRPEGDQTPTSSPLPTHKEQLGDAGRKMTKHEPEGLSAAPEAPTTVDKEKVESDYAQGIEVNQSTPSIPLSMVKGKRTGIREKMSQQGSQRLSAVEEGAAQGKENLESNYTEGLEAPRSTPSSLMSTVKEELGDVKEKVAQHGSEGLTALGEGTAQQKENVGSNLTEGLDAMQSTSSSLLSTAKEKLADEKEEVAQHGSEGLEALQEGAAQQKENIGSNLTDGLEAMQSTPSSLLSTVKEKRGDTKEKVAENGSEGLEALQEGAAQQKEKIGSNLSEGLEAVQSTPSSLLSTVKGKLADAKEKMSELGSKGLSAIQEAIGQGKENVESIYTQRPEGGQTVTSSPLPNAKESMEDAKGKVAENGPKGLSTIQEATAGEKEKVGGLEPSPAEPSIPFSMVRGKRIDIREKMSQQGSKEPSALEEGTAHQEENIGSNLTHGLEAMQSTPSSLLSTAKEKLADEKEEVAQHGSEGLEALREGAVQQKEKIGSNLTEGLEAMQSTPSSLLSTVKGKLADAKEKMSELGSKGLSAIQEAIAQGKESVGSIYTQRPGENQPASSSPLPTVKGKRNVKENVAEPGSKGLPMPREEGTAHETQKVGSNYTGGLEGMHSTPSTLLSTMKELLGDVKENATDHGSKGALAAQEGAAHQKEGFGWNSTEVLEATQSTPSSLLSTVKEKQGDVKENVTEHGSEGLSALEEAAAQPKEDVKSNYTQRPGGNLNGPSGPLSKPVSNGDGPHEATEAHSLEKQSNMSREDQPDVINAQSSANGSAKASGDRWKSASSLVQKAIEVSKSVRDALAKQHSEGQTNGESDKEQLDPNGTTSTEKSVRTKELPGKPLSEVEEHAGNKKQDLPDEAHDVKNITSALGKEELGRPSDIVTNRSVDLGSQEEKINVQPEMVERSDDFANKSLAGKEEQEEETWVTAEVDATSPNDNKTSPAMEDRNLEDAQQRKLNESRLRDELMPTHARDSSMAQKLKEAIPTIVIGIARDRALSRTAIPDIDKGNSSSSLQEEKTVSRGEVGHSGVEGLTAAPNLTGTRSREETKPKHEGTDSLGPSSPRERTDGDSSIKIEIPEESHSRSSRSPKLSIFARTAKVVKDAYSSARERLRQK